MIKYVTVLIDVPVDDLDFSDCKKAARTVPNEDLIYFVRAFNEQIVGIATDDELLVTQLMNAEIGEQ